MKTARKVALAVFIGVIPLFVCSAYVARTSPAEPKAQSERITHLRRTTKTGNFIKLGDHVIAEFLGCHNLNNFDLLEPMLDRAARAANATVLGFECHQFEPQGMSGLVLLQESHISIHTWPEYGYAAIDIYTCGDHLETDKALEVLEEFFQPKEVEVMRIDRGHTVFKKD